MPNDKVHAKAHDDSFDWADDIADADRECGYSRAVVKVKCKRCGRPCMLHCTRCNLQVTGCLCTMIGRFGLLEAYKAAAKQVGQRRARAAFANMGYVLPILPDPNLPD